MRNELKLALGVAGLVAAAHASAQLTLYEHQGFRGPAYTIDGTADHFPLGANDRASSAVVENGQWQVCEDIGFRGRCVVLAPGSYDSLRSMDMNNVISSARPVSPPVGAYVPPPMAQPNYDYRWRPNERIYQANVTSVRAVVGAPEQRCWIERQPVVNERGGGANIPGAIIGGVLGGVLGHQIGSGRGNDVATAGGAVAGAAIGANVGRDGRSYSSQDVQRCTNVSSNARPDFYDVTYNFNGVEHHVQMSSPPGPTIAVNSNGEPRG